MQLEELMNILPHNGESEFHIFICTCQTLGIPYTMHWTPGQHNEALHKKAIKEAGLCLTHNALSGVCIGDHMYVFSTGKGHWTCGANPDDYSQHKGHGPDGAFLYVVNTKTNEVVKHRTKYQRKDSTFDESVTGVRALANQYNFTEVLTDGGKVA